MDNRTSRRGFLGIVVGAAVGSIIPLPKPKPPAALSIPFETLPTNIYIRGPRYLVVFGRLVTPRFTRNVARNIPWPEPRL